MADEPTPETVDVDVWILVDENGEYEAHADLEDMGESGDGLAKRLWKVTLTMPIPKFIELKAVVNEKKTVSEIKIVTE